MNYYSKDIRSLVDHLAALPGIGAKSAQRLAFHILAMPPHEVSALANSMLHAREHIHQCKECFTLTDGDICPICANAERDHSTIMVVQETKDLAAYEKTQRYNG